MNDYVLKMKISVIFTFHKPINWDWWPKPVTPHIWEVEEEGSQAQGLPGVQSYSKATLGNLSRPCLKIKSGRKDLRTIAQCRVLAYMHKAID